MKLPGKGPKIELSKLKPGSAKVPSGLTDLWNELRSQHLVPVVVLLVAGLVAIPFLLGDSSSKDETGVGPGAVAAAETPAVTASDLIVSKYQPGLRDYRRRFKDRSARNPFQPFGSAKKKSSEVGEAGEEGGATLLETPESEGGGSEGGESPAGETPPSGEGSEESPSEGGEEGGGNGGEKPKKEPAEGPDDETIDVQITTVHLGGSTTIAPVRRQLPQLTILPSNAVPALTYVGPSADGKKALMTVSAEVTQLLGNSPCVVKASSCQLLALKLGEPETLVFGPRGLTYRVKVERIGDQTVPPQTGNGKSGDGAKGDTSKDEGSVGRRTIAFG